MGRQCNKKNIVEKSKDIHIKKTTHMTNNHKYDK